MSPELPEALAVALRVITSLEKLGIEYHLGGSFASSIHGVPRQTQNVDLVVDLRSEHVEPLERELPSDFYVDTSRAREQADR